jgi:hypothetical protein
LLVRVNDLDIGRGEFMADDFFGLSSAPPDFWDPRQRRRGAGLPEAMGCASQIPAGGLPEVLEGFLGGAHRR